MIYLDNASTKETNRICTRAIAEALYDNWGNPSSIHFLGVKAKTMLETDREDVARFINANPEEIIFTSGGCESNTLALCGFIKARPRRVTLITTPIEHKSIMMLAEDHCSVRYVECQELTGIVFMKSLEEKLQEAQQNDMIPLVSIHYANNEIGTIQDIKTITSLVHKYNGIMHTDATQMMCQEPIDVKELDVDMLSFSGQKLGTPKGVGVLYKKTNINIKPIIYGSQECGLRGGTENTAYIHCLAALIRKGYKYFHKQDVVQYFLEKLASNNIRFISLGHPKERLSNHLSLCFIDFKEGGVPVIHGESLLYILDSKDIYVSTGSACNSHSQGVSYVAKAIKIPEKYQYSIVRFTFSNSTTKKQVDKVVKAIVEGYNMLKAM